MAMIHPEIPNIFSFFTDEAVSSDVLRPAERACTEGFGATRLATFSAGRYCARQALSGMGLQDLAIPTGADRAPVWPAGVAGSISHSAGLAGALVCATTHHPSIGMDIEHRRAVDATLWDIIFDRQEQERISAAASPVDMATLYFSLKESYYKMQHPLTRRFLDFLDVRVEEGPAGLIINRLKALPEATPGHRTGHLLTTDFVVTWVLAEP